MRLIGLSIALLCAFFSANAGRRIITVTDTAGFVGPCLGNGNIGLSVCQDGMRADKVFMHSCVETGSAEFVSTIFPAVNPINFTINGARINLGRGWKQELDMDNASVTTYGLINDSITASVTLRALRNLPCVLMADITVSAINATDVVVVNKPVASGLTSIEENVMRRVWCEDGGRRMIRTQMPFNGGEDVLVASTAFLPGDGWTEISADSIKISLARGEVASFSVLSSMLTTADVADPWNESERMTIYALRQGRDELVSRHCQAWDKLWTGNIEIDGDDRLQQITDVALYNLYSSIREGSRKSIAPMGLTSDKYYGHLFWDADFWIFPPLAVLHPSLARGIVDFRIDGHKEAVQRARLYGFRGAMFPWEADAQGEESTPTFAMTGPLEHHITGVVALAMSDYFNITSDSSFLKESAFPVISDCADFFVSRASINSDGSFSIRNVVGADEYAIGVADNAFTNAVAKKTLLSAARFAGVLGKKGNPMWTKVAEGLRFNRNDDGIILEYDGFDGQQIKQADVALLAFPLGLIADNQEIDRTIRFYDKFLDKVNGPAMSHTVMAVNYARMGNGEEAYRQISDGVVPYLVGPYHSIAETPVNGQTYFMTGAGGLLQGIMFGFAGVSIDDSKGIIQVDSSLPKHIKKVTINFPDGRKIERRR